VWGCAAAASKPLGEGRGGKPVVRCPSQLVPGEKHLIVLGDGERKGGQFAFRPEESDRELNQRLNTPLKTKNK